MAESTEVKHYKKDLGSTSVDTNEIVSKPVILLERPHVQQDVSMNVPKTDLKSAVNDCSIKSESFYVSEELIQENEQLREEVEREELRIKTALTKESEDEDSERKTKQLMFLLSRTQFYAKYLSEKISESNDSELSMKSSTRPSKRRKREGNDDNIYTESNENSEIVAGTRKSTKRKNAVDRKFDSNMIKTCIKNVKENENLENPGPVPKSASFESPEYFEGELKDYQIQGLEWLKCLYENGVNGILADEMGLGKTIQTIALICYLVSKKTSGPFLIVAPLSTISNWMIEFQRFAPEIPKLLFHGNASRRKELENSFRQVSLSNGFRMYPVVITTYEIPLREKQFFFNRKWKYIIVDEGHRLKNYKCQLARVLKQTISENRLLLTGTPLQNNLEELWSLLNFLLPEIFNDLALFESWLNIEQLDESQTIIQQEAQNKVVTIMHQILSPFILRRMKSDVNLNLPPKKEILVYAPMTKLQWELYTATMNNTIAKMLGVEKDFEVSKGKRLCSLNKRYTEADDDDFILEERIKRDETSDSVFTTSSSKYLVKDRDGNTCRVYLTMQNPWMQLRKISNHPYLVQMPINEVTGELLVTENIIKMSGKMLVLDELLQHLKALGHKVLIFSTFTMLLDLIEELFILRKYQYVRLDGSVNLETRTENINVFTHSSETFGFLISTRAGGLGLNLTSADTVIIFDSDWNPQVDLQAQDRCHRIGQTKPVVVYRLVTKGTIDEKIIDVAIKKKKLGKLVLHKNMFKRKGVIKSEDAISIEDLRDLLESEDHSKVVHTSGNVLTQELLTEILDRSDATFS